MIDPFLESPTAQWHLRLPSGGQFGPSSADTMRQWLTEGRITPDALVWRDGWTDWKAAGAVFPGLAQRAAMAAGPAMVGAQPAGYGAAPAGYPAGYGAQPGGFAGAGPANEFAVGESSSSEGGDGGGSRSYRRGNDQVVQASVIVFGIALVILLPVLIYALSSQTTKEEMEGSGNKKNVITRKKDGSTSGPSTPGPTKPRKKKGGDDEGGTDVDGGPSMRL